MSNKKKNSKDKESGGSGGGFSGLPIVVFVVGAGILVWLIMGSFSSSDKPTDSTAVEETSNEMTNTVEATTPVEATAESAGEEPEPLSDADRQKLLGSWERTDNPPYSIEIRLVKPNGITDARYLNPRSINVAEAFMAGKDGKLAFFMKMNDRGYEGSTYTLVYHEEDDMLVGEYYQATQQQTYEVAFQRVK